MIDPAISPTKQYPVWPNCADCGHPAEEHADHWGSIGAHYDGSDRCLAENCPCEQYEYKKWHHAPRPYTP